MNVFPMFFPVYRDRTSPVDDVGGRPLFFISANGDGILSCISKVVEYFLFSLVYDTAVARHLRGEDYMQLQQW